MAVPRENREYAERQRVKDKIAREEMRREMAFASPMISLADMVRAYGITEIPVSPPTPTMAWYDDHVDAIGYAGSETIMQPAMQPAKEYLSSEEGEHLENRIRELESLLAERDEMIEALVADIEDVDILKEENARLRIVLALKSKPEDAKPADAEWIVNTEEGSECPRHLAGKRIDIRWADGRETLNRGADEWGWIKPTPGVLNRLIASYRIVG